QRVVDLICPLAFGQRALIVSPPKAGKTVMLQAVAEGVALNHPSAILLILLVDERPEEVSEMVDWGRGEVIASSFDLSHERHVAVADMVFEHARRQVELGKDVVIVLDSLTRLARSHNTTGRGSGRTMSGGLDAAGRAARRPADGGRQTTAPAGPGRAPAGEGDRRAAGAAAARQDERRAARRRQLTVSFRPRSACSCPGSTGAVGTCWRPLG